MLLHERPDQPGDRVKYSQEVVSTQEAMVGSADGSAWMRLLDVDVLDRRAVTSLSGETREGSVKTPALVPRRGGEYTGTVHMHSSC